MDEAARACNQYLEHKSTHQIKNPWKIPDEPRLQMCKCAGTQGSR